VFNEKFYSIKQYFKIHSVQLKLRMLPIYLVSPMECNRVERSLAAATLGFGKDETESIKLLLKPKSGPFFTEEIGSSHGLRR
jgi:hypothetical protein